MSLPRGITTSRYGFRVTVQVRGVQKERRFARGTPVSEMRDWRERARLELLLRHRKPG